MKRVKNIVLLVSTIWLSVLVGGCNVYDHYSAADDPDDQDFVTLVLNVGLVSPTRAAADNDRELMHSLRIILLDAEEGGMVEYNTRLGFNTGAESLDYHFIRTKPGKKKIFLIANEEGIASVGGVTGYSNLTALLDDLGAQGEDGSMSSTEAESRLKEVWFTPGDYSGANGWIPLSSSYAFEIKESELTADNRRVEKTFYLVHAATKFEIKFVNHRNNWVTVSGLSISSISDNMYLMANFEGTPAEEKMGPAPYDGLYWIDWLKEVSNATTANPNNPDNKDINAQYGWITDYNIPSGNSRDFTLTANQTINSNGEMNVPIFYCPESRNPGQNGQGQAYSLNITLTYPTYPYYRREQLSLDNLKALFRNTHVKITVVFHQNLTIQIDVVVCPWDEKDTVIHFD